MRNKQIEELKPGISRSWLLLFSGLLWSLVGIMLCRQAVIWFLSSGHVSHWWVSLVSLGGISVVYQFGFKKIALKNIHRIRLLPALSCAFAFQSWKSYILIGFMISLGIFFRESGLIPIYILAFIYLIIGGSLFISSLHFYHHIFRKAPGSE